VAAQPGADPVAAPVPVGTPADLIPKAFERVRRQLPTPIPQIGPADLAPDGYAFVQNPAIFWVDQCPASGRTSRRRRLWRRCR